jgi:dTDP-4-amino-4,6-dideoxygalactose transaminase
MKIERTIPPAAPLVYWRDVLTGFAGIALGRRYLHKFETELKEYFRVRYVFPVSSGKAALVLILQALKSLSGRRQVLIPAYTCFSVPSAVIKAGLDVALCDIDLATIDFDYKLLDQEMSSETLCVVTNHLFGRPAEMDCLLALARGKGVFVVEDAAQAMGGRYKGRKLGTIGDVGFFSMGRGKNVTCGSGGVIVTDSPQIGEAIGEIYRKLKYPGTMEEIRGLFELMVMSVFVHPLLYWFPASLRFLRLGQTFFFKDFPVMRLSGVKAGFLSRWRARLEESNTSRIEAVADFRDRLGLRPSGSGGIAYLRLPVIAASEQTRDRLQSLAVQRGLGITSMYPCPLAEIEELIGTFNGRQFPSARRISERLLTIPTHHLLSEGDKRRICEVFREVPPSEWSIPWESQ